MVLFAKYGSDRYAGQPYAADVGFALEGFFPGRPPAAGAAHALALDVLGKQLLTTAGYGTGVDTE